MGKKLTQLEFIKKIKKTHGNKYDYSKVEYNGSGEKICIICPEHGEFWQIANEHSRGAGCPLCWEKRRGQSVKLNLDDFLVRAKEIHGNKYNYSKVYFNNVMDKVCIICPEHGEFWQSPNDHLNGGKNCPKCSHRSYKKTTEEFIKESKTKFGDKFIYDKVSYERKDKPVCIICPEHGEFWQKPNVHLKSIDGCPKCTNKKNGLKKRISIDEFIEKSHKIHGNKYDYSKVEYIDTDTKICIICPEHGEFWQTPHNHIGQKQGCPFCKESHLSKEIKNILLENKILFEQEKTFKWLKYKKSLYLDFYLPHKNIVIECQGEQHFKKFRWETNDEKLIKRQLRDKIKKELCEEHNLKMLYFSFKKFNDDIITDKNELINIINKN